VLYSYQHKGDFTDDKVPYINVSDNIHHYAPCPTCVAKPLPAGPGAKAHNRFV
jgi:hypothetical protein